MIFFFCFVETSFLIHATVQKNKLNMRYRKQAMQIQTEDQMSWFGKLQYQEDETETLPPQYLFVLQTGLTAQQKGTTDQIRLKMHSDCVQKSFFDPSVNLNMKYVHFIFLFKDSFKQRHLYLCRNAFCWIVFNLHNM